MIEVGEEEKEEEENQLKENLINDGEKEINGEEKEEKEKEKKMNKTNHLRRTRGHICITGSKTTQETSGDSEVRTGS